MNKKGLIAKISIKYVLPTCIWISGGFRTISRVHNRAKYQKSCSFEINFKESKIFKYVHVQMALPKKNF